MSPTETESIEQTRQTEQVEQTALKKLHWRSALHTVLRLRRSGGLIDHDILAALQISLNPPSPASSIVSPTTLRRIEKYMSWKRTRNYWRNAGKHIKKQRGRRFIVGGIYCEMLIDQYEEMTTRYQMNGAYDIFRWAVDKIPFICRASHAKNPPFLTIKAIFASQSPNTPAWSKPLHLCWDRFHYSVWPEASLQNVWDCSHPPSGWINVIINGADRASTVGNWMPWHSSRRAFLYGNFNRPSSKTI